MMERRGIFFHIWKPWLHINFALIFCMASFLAFSAAFLAIISRFHLGISTPLGSWLGTYKDFFLLNDGAKGNLFPYLKTLTTYKFCPNFLYGLFFGLFCSLLGHHFPLPLGNFNPTGIMAGDLQRFFFIKWWSEAESFSIFENHRLVHVVRQFLYMDVMTKIFGWKFIMVF